MSQKSSEPELSKSACAKSVDSKVADSATEVQHKAPEALKSEEKAAGNLKENKFFILDCKEVAGFVLKNLAMSMYK